MLKYKGQIKKNTLTLHKQENKGRKTVKTQSSLCCLLVLALPIQEYPDNKQLSSHADVHHSRNVMTASPVLIRK